MNNVFVKGLKRYYSSNLPGVTISAYNACSMADVYHILGDIGKNVFHNTGSAVGRPLWFRGQEHEKYMLVPSLYRNRENQKNNNSSYSKLSLAEEYRHQNFSARVNHLTQASSKSRVVWQEILQHHLGKTRFMDWSESVEKAVYFALEAFIDTKDTYDNRIRRKTITPGIWVVNPYRLNEHVYDFFTDAQNIDYIVDALRGLFPENELGSTAAELQEELRYGKDMYFNFDENNIIDVAINGLVSVCILDEYYHYNAANMKHLLKRHEFNPFFYLLVRYYADALPVKADLNMDLIPPVASVQPYHSERIRAQRGTFTIFPNYCRTQAANELAKAGMDVIAIEAQKRIADCFCNIRLCDPLRIAEELIYAGERRPDVYPDIQVYADYLETERMFL